MIHLHVLAMRYTLAPVIVGAKVMFVLPIMLLSKPLLDARVTI